MSVDPERGPSDPGGPGRPFAGVEPRQPPTGSGQRLHLHHRSPFGGPPGWAASNGGGVVAGLNRCRAPAGGNRRRDGRRSGPAGSGAPGNSGPGGPIASRRRTPMDPLRRKCDPAGGSRGPGRSRASPPGVAKRPPPAGCGAHRPGGGGDGPAIRGAGAGEPSRPLSFAELGPGGRLCRRPGR